MQFRMVTPADVKAIRDARKAITRISRKLKKLCETERASLGDERKNWKKAALDCWRMLDEAEALGLTESSGKKGEEMLRIRLAPSGDASMWFPL